MRPTPSTRTRDAGLALISRINRWIIGGAIAFTGVISLIAANSFHGRTLSASARSQSAVSPATGSGGSSSSSGSLQQPASSPSPSPVPVVPSAPVVVSGGS